MMKETRIASSVIARLSETAKKKWFAALSLVLFLFSFWLRWSGLDWQLPDPRYGDEEAMIQMTHQISWENHLRVGGKTGFWYGPAFNYLMALTFTVFDWTAVKAGLFPSSKDIPPWTHFWVGRALSALLSLGTLIILVFLFKNAFGRLAALGAGLVYSLNEIEIHLSTIAKSDTLTLFLSTLTLYLMIKMITANKRIYYILAGIVYGAAVASKLFAVGLFIPLIAGHIIAQAGDGPLKKLKNALKDKRWMILPPAALLGFVLSNPQSVLAMGAFIREGVGQMLFGYMGEGNREYKTLADLMIRVRHIYLSLLSQVRTPSLLALILALAGLIATMIRQFKIGLLMLIAFLSFNLFILPATAAYGSSHHYLVLVPLLGLWIGTAVQAGWELILRIKVSFWRVSAHGILILAMIFAAGHLMRRAIRVPAIKTGGGLLSRSTDFRKWMIDHIPPGARIAYDRYGTDLITGYFDVVKKSEYEESLESYRQNYDYVVMSAIRINDYKIFPELLKRSPLAVFDYENVEYMSRLAIYKLDGERPAQAHLRNFYTETLPRQANQSTTIGNPSFENDNLTEGWGVRFYDPGRDEQMRPWQWWDAVRHPSGFLVEKSSEIRKEGAFSLRINFTEEKPSSPREKELANHLSESVETADSSKEKTVQIGQVIPHDFLDSLRSFSLGYYLRSGSRFGRRPAGTVKLRVVAESIGGQYLNRKTYVLYDAKQAGTPELNKWLTFSRNIKADFSKPFGRWKDIEFVTFVIEVVKAQFGSLDVYFDDVQTAETLATRRFEDWRRKNYGVEPVAR